MRSYAVERSDAAPLDWRKSTFSWANGDCVQVASRSGGAVWVRDTKNPDGLMLAFDRSPWSTFVGAIRTDGTAERNR